MKTMVNSSTSDQPVNSHTLNLYVQKLINSIYLGLPGSRCARLLRKLDSIKKDRKEVTVSGHILTVEQQPSRYTQVKNYRGGL